MSEGDLISAETPSSVGLSLSNVPFRLFLRTTGRRFQDSWEPILLFFSPLDDFLRLFTLVLGMLGGKESILTEVINDTNNNFV